MKFRLVSQWVQLNYAGSAIILMKFLKHLYVQVLLAVIAGDVLAVF